MTAMDFKVAAVTVSGTTGLTMLPTAALICVDPVLIPRASPEPGPMLAAGLDEVHAAADARLLIPMRPGLRSLNVAQAAAMVLGEALRQTSGFPKAPFPKE